MQADPASLENLRDIAVPPPVPWWPPAPGWWVAIAILTGALVALAYRGWRSWQANAYRRAALGELQSATTVSQIAEILKRTALVAFPRIDTAALSGAAWCEWLGQTGAAPVHDSVALALTRGVFDTVEPPNVEDVSAFASDWIQHHQTTASSVQRKEQS